MANGRNINLMRSEMMPIAGDASFRTFYRIKGKKKIKLQFQQKKKNIKI